MRGPNPFVPWGAGQADFKGRKQELEAYRSMLKQAEGRRPMALLVEGAPGSGRSALLRRFAEEAEREGFFAPIFSAGGGEKLSSLIPKMRAGLANYAEEKAAEGAITGRVAAAMRSAADEGDFLVSFCRITVKHAPGLVVLIDGADRLKEPSGLEAFLREELRKAGAQGLGLLVVLSSTRGFPGFRGLGRAARLGAFDEHDIREMVESALKKGPPKMGEECLRSVIEESGGNPLVAKTICWVIYDKLPDKEKVITQRHYLTYYPLIMGTLAREFFDPLYEELPDSERQVLRAFAAEGKPAHISDIARKIGKRHATTLAMRLAGRGQLERVDRGLYKVFTKLYGRYVLQRG